MSIYVALVAESEFIGIETFDGVDFAKGFCRGFSRGSSEYGAGGASGYVIPDEFPDMADAHKSAYIDAVTAYQKLINPAA